MKIVRKIVAVGLLSVGLLVLGVWAGWKLAPYGVACGAGVISRPAAGYNFAPEPAVQWGRGSVGISSTMASDRKRQFTAELQLQTTDESDVVVKKITELAEKFSGYSVYSNMVSVKVKVPVKNSKDFLAEVERLGTVIFREITSQDVTNEYRDLELKCKNLRALRDRFAELLKKAEKVDDILKIESELARITTELEQATGLFKALRNSVDMMVVNIKITAVKQVDPLLNPVAWVPKLGNIIYGSAIKDEFAVKSTLPEGFVTCYRDKDVIKAIDGNMSVLQVKSHDDLPGATPEFYQKLITKHFKENNYKDVAAKKLDLPDNRRGCLVSACIGDYSYYVAVVFYKSGWFCKQNKILVIELYGKTANVEKVSMNEIIKGFKF